MEIQLLQAIKVTNPLVPGDLISQKIFVFQNLQISTFRLLF